MIEFVVFLVLLLIVNFNITIYEIVTWFPPWIHTRHRRDQYFLVTVTSRSRCFFKIWSRSWVTTVTAVTPMSNPYKAQLNYQANLAKIVSELRSNCKPYTKYCYKKTQEKNGLPKCCLSISFLLSYRSFFHIHKTFPSMSHQWFYDDLNNKEYDN